MTRKTLTRNKSNGHYIIDLLVAMALMVILVSLSSPSLTALLKGSTLQRETNDLIAVVEKLSIEALQNEKDITLVVYPDSYVSFLEGATLRALNSRSFKPPVKALIGPPGKKEVKFYKTGVATPITITLKDTERTCKLTISLRGRVTELC